MSTDGGEGQEHGMTSQAPRAIHIVIITRERRDDLVQVLDSILPQIKHGDMLTVLENGCPANSTAGLDSDFPTVDFARSEENLGVPGGRNFAAMRGDQPLVVFIDDDATVQPGTLDVVRDRFKDEESLGCIAFRIDAPETGLPRSHEFPFREKSGFDVERAATYFVGGGFALRRTAFYDIGAFDDRLFYGMEELDLSYRLIGAGWRILYVPSATVIHYASPAGRLAGQNVYFMMRNRIIVSWKNLPWRFLVTQVGAWSVYLFARAVRSRLVNHWAKGIADGVSVASAADRRPIPQEGISFLKAHQGRLWW